VVQELNVDILVFSHHHGLLPFSWRLKREEHNVKTVVWNQRYNRAWEGRLDKLLTSKPTVENLTNEIEAAKAGELVVITDSLRGQEMFKDAASLYGVPKQVPFSHPPSLLLGGWFAGGTLSAPHWLVPDWGLWPGGLGPTVLGGCTLLRTPRTLQLPEELTSALQAQAYSGLLVVGLDYREASRELVPIGFLAGWPFLFTHLFISGLQNLGNVLAGESPQTQGTAFEVALPVSQPPWPIPGAPGPEPVQLTGLSNEVARQCFFHDLALKGSEVWTAGLDGLVAVARGSGASLASAQSKALAVAHALPLQQKQFRVDVGCRVPSVLVGLEELGYL
jgi:hypothetical protein